MTNLVISAINFYQRFLSPDHSFWGKFRYPFGYCRFSPTCSEYAKAAFLEHGILRGAAKAALRILRCNPFSHPGFDPLTK